MKGKIRNKKQIFSIVGVVVLIIGICIIFSPKMCSDRIVKVINKQLENSLKTTKEDYKYSEKFESFGYTYYVYESVEESNSIIGNYKSKLSIIYDNYEFVGVKIETNMPIAKNYSNTKYSLHKISQFDLKKMDYDKYLQNIKKSNTSIGNNYVIIDNKVSQETFKLVKDKYYNHLKSSIY